jgi:hypothetical protein
MVGARRVAQLSRSGCGGRRAERHSSRLVWRIAAGAKAGALCRLMVRRFRYPVGSSLWQSSAARRSPTSGRASPSHLGEIPGRRGTVHRMCQGPQGPHDSGPHALIALRHCPRILMDCLCQPGNVLFATASIESPFYLCESCSRGIEGAHPASGRSRMLIDFCLDDLKGRFPQFAAQYPHRLAVVRSGALINSAALALRAASKSFLCSAKKIDKTLHRVGSTLKDIVWMTVSVSYGRCSQRLTDIRTEIYGEQSPASTLLTAAAFAVPEIMVKDCLRAEQPPRFQPTRGKLDSGEGCEIFAFRQPTAYIRQCGKRRRHSRDFEPSTTQEYFEAVCV